MGSVAVVVMVMACNFEESRQRAPSTCDKVRGFGRWTMTHSIIQRLWIMEPWTTEKKENESLEGWIVLLLFVWCGIFSQVAGPWNAQILIFWSSIRTACHYCILSLCAFWCILQLRGSGNGKPEVPACEDQVAARELLALIRSPVISALFYTMTLDAFPVQCASKVYQRQKRVRDLRGIISMGIPSEILQY